MAFLSETPTWRNGVTQLELTTPVRGSPTGESNVPLRELADRTSWLKAQVDTLVAEVALRAPILSPSFTGTPRAPTPAEGDTSTRIVTTEFLGQAVRGLLNKVVAPGTVALTVAEAARPILLFTGALATACTVTMPNGLTGEWVAVNRTTGPGTLTLRTLGGAGLQINQGRQQPVFSDGLGMFPMLTEGQDVALGGGSIIPTAAPTTGDDRIASTGFARRFVRGAATIVATGGATIAVTDIQAASPVVVLIGTPTSGFTLLLPSEPAAWVVRNTTGQLAMLRTASQPSGLLVQPGRTVVAVAEGAGIVGLDEMRDARLSGAPTATTPAPTAAAAEVVTAEWVRALLASLVQPQPGDTKVSLRPSDPGWVALDGRTIGTAGSGATSRADADCAALYAVLWTNLPTLPVSGGRGVSAAADFAAGKTIALPDLRGRALVAAGAGPGLTVRELGSTWGTETHALTLAEMPQHAHGGATGAAGGHGHVLTVASAGGHTHAGSTSPAGDHIHPASTSADGEHNHNVRSDGVAFNNASFYINNSEGTLHAGSSRIANQTTVDGLHSHGVIIGLAGNHTHAVTVAADGAHTHPASAAAAPDHSHAIGAEGGQAAHNNTQPSFALHVLAKL